MRRETGDLYIAFFKVPVLSEPFALALPIVQDWQPPTASLRRSLSRAWKVSQRPPIPTALFSMTTESVPAGTTRPVEALAAPGLQIAGVGPKCFFGTIARALTEFAVYISDVAARIGDHNGRRTLLDGERLVPVEDRAIVQNLIRPS